MSAIESMTSFLWNTTQGKDVVKIPLITQSAENLASCLNSLLKAGAVNTSDVGSDLQEKVNICHLALLMAVNCYFIEMHKDTLLIYNFDDNHNSLTLPNLHLSVIIK